MGRTQKVQSFHLSKGENYDKYDAHALDFTPVGIIFHSFDSYLKHKEQLSDIVKFKSDKIKNLGVSVYTNAQMNELNARIDGTN